MRVLVTDDSGFLKVLPLLPFSPLHLSHIPPPKLVAFSLWTPCKQRIPTFLLRVVSFKNYLSSLFYFSSPLHVSCPTSKTPPFFFFPLPTSAFLSLSLCVFVLLSCALFCEVFTGIIQPDSLELCCFNTFLHYLRFSDLFASSPKPPNDLICPTFCSTIQPPSTFTCFSIISCYFISVPTCSKNSPKLLLAQ